MPKPTVAQLAAQFIANLQGQGLTIFRENQPVAGGLGQEQFIYILPPGQHGGNTGKNELIQLVHNWVNGTAAGPRSIAQAKNIAREVWNLSPLVN